MWKIYAPVKDATGTWASVRFVNGVGETNNAALVEWFKKHGYRVDDVATTNGKSSEAFLNEVVATLDNEQSEPDVDAMTPNELREYLKEKGYGSKIKNIRNKDKLLEILRG